MRIRSSAVSVVAGILLVNPQANAAEAKTGDRAVWLSCDIIAAETGKTRTDTYVFDGRGMLFYSPVDKTVSRWSSEYRFDVTDERIEWKAEFTSTSRIYVRILGSVDRRTLVLHESSVGAAVLVEDGKCKLIEPRGTRQPQF